MRSRWMLLTAVVMLVLVPAMAATAKGGPKPKVTICHIPPGNPGEAHTISVSGNAATAHLAHGDTEGACPVERPGRDGTDPKDDDEDNRSPVASAGADRCVLYGAPTLLNGSASLDPDGDALIYDWDVLLRPAGSGLVDGDLMPNDNKQSPTFLADRLGTYRFDLEVTDTHGASDDDSVDVAVRMSVSLDAGSYEVDEGETTPITITLHAVAPQAVPVSLTLDADEAVIVAESDDGPGDAITSIQVATGTSSVVVHLLGVEDDDADDDTGVLVASVGTGNCTGEASATVDVVDDESVTGFLPSWVAWFVRLDDLLLF